MELADALGLHHVVVNVAHGDGVDGADGVGEGGLAKIAQVSGKITSNAFVSDRKLFFSAISDKSTKIKSFCQNSTFSTRQQR